LAKQILFLVVLLLLCLTPFLNKAVHIDDTLWIYSARQIIKEPTNPYNFTIQWLDLPEDINPTRLIQPPLYFYLLAGAITLLGEKEFVLHGLIEKWCET